MIIIAYGLVDEKELMDFEPKVAVLGDNNKIVEMLVTEPASTVDTCIA